MSFKGLVRDNLVAMRANSLIRLELLSSLRTRRAIHHSTCMHTVGHVNFTVAHVRVRARRIRDQVSYKIKRVNGV